VPSGELAFNVLAAPARRGAKERCATPWPRAGLPMRELAGYSLGPKIGSIGTKAHNPLKFLQLGAMASKRSLNASTASPTGRTKCGAIGRQAEFALGKPRLWYRGWPACREPCQ
jgi:hypothetical protein